MRSAKTKRKLSACGLCKPHKQGGKPHQTARGQKQYLRERADLRDADEALREFASGR